MPKYCFIKPNRKEIRHFKPCDAARIAKFAAESPNYGRTHVLACIAKGLGFTHVCLSVEEYMIARAYVVGGYAEQTVDVKVKFIDKVDGFIESIGAFGGFVKTDKVSVPGKVKLPTNKITAILTALLVLAEGLRRLIPPLADVKVDKAQRKCYLVDEVIVAKYCKCRKSLVVEVREEITGE
jgi:hypothetical protein